MATISQIEGEIRSLLDRLIQHDLAIAINPTVRRRIARGMRITWKSPAKDGLPYTESGFGSIQDYCACLEWQAYTAVLFDGSLLQMSYDFARARLAGHRLCYYPCPFLIEPADLLSDPILDVVEMYREAGEEAIRLRSPVRFDYDPRNAAEYHPACHVHFGWPRSRCAVVGPLGVGVFGSFVFSQFYPDAWRSHAFLRTWRNRFRKRTITVVQEKRLHFAWRGGA